jgi:arylsulfatase A-like enzyme
MEARAGRSGLRTRLRRAFHFLLRWPGHVPRGVTRSRLTGIPDIGPTVLDAAGLDTDLVRPRLDGRSLLERNARDRLLLEYWREGNTGIPTWASLRTRTFQYTEYYARDDETRIFREYYRLRPDPWQLRNVLRGGTTANDPDLPALAANLARVGDAEAPPTSDSCP